MRVSVSRNTIPKMHDYIVISFFYPVPFLEIAKGRRIFDMLNEFNLMPDKYIMGNTSKRVGIIYEDIDKFLENNWGFVTHTVEYDNIIHSSTYLEHFELFRAKKPKYRGRLCRGGIGGRIAHSALSLNIRAAGLREKDVAILEAFIRACLKLSTPDFARIQFYTGKEELESCRGKEPKTTLVGRQLSKKCLPDLYNVSIWGRPYVELLGKERLLSTPCFKVEELPDGMVWMQLSENVFDINGCWEEIKEERERARVHLNSNVFHDRTLPHDHTYTVPKFDLTAISKIYSHIDGDDK